MPPAKRATEASGRSPNRTGLKLASDESGSVLMMNCSTHRSGIAVSTFFSFTGSTWSATGETNRQLSASAVAGSTASPVGLSIGGAGFGVGAMRCRV